MRPDDRNVAKAFGRLLRELRANADLTQEELADGANIERTYVSFLERGLRQPSIRVLIALSKALRVPAHEIVRELEGRVSSGTK